MINSRRGPIPGRRRRLVVALWRSLLPLGFLAGVTAARAQGVLTPPGEGYERPAVSQSMGVGPGGGIPPLAGSADQSLGLAQWGPIDFHPHFLYRVIYGDGVPAGPGLDETTLIQEFSPGLLMILGNQWTLDYTPTLRIYSNNKFAGSTDQSVVLSGKAAYHDWSFGLSQNYSQSDSTLVETQAPTEQQNFLTTLQAARQLSSQLSAQFSVNQSFRSSSEFTSSQDIHQWTASTGLNYQFWSGFGIGISGSGGVDLITPGSGMTFEQMQGSLNWQPGDKITLSVSGGAEDRQLNGTDLIDPTFSGTVVYRPLEHTSAAVTASRSVSPSYFQDLVTVNTSVTATFQQRFLERFSFEVIGSYSTTPYVGFATVSDASAFSLSGAPLASVSAVTRQDDYESVRVSLSCTLLKRGTASVFYSRSVNTSSLSAFSLTSTQVGLELGYRY